jgi:hypothetical protein
MRQFYKLTLWKLQNFLLITPDLHHGLLSSTVMVTAEFAIQLLPPTTTCSFAIHSPTMNTVEYSPGATKKDGGILVLAAAVITGLRLARDPRAGSQTQRVINAVEDGIFLANQIYDKALLRFGQGNIEFKW